jgi:hypothetical protein
VRNRERASLGKDIHLDCRIELAIGCVFATSIRGRDDVTVVAVRESIGSAAPGDVILDE